MEKKVKPTAKLAGEWIQSSSSKLIKHLKNQQEAKFKEFDNRSRKRPQSVTKQMRILGINKPEHELPDWTGLEETCCPHSVLSSDFQSLMTFINTDVGPLNQFGKMWH